MPNIAKRTPGVRPLKALNDRQRRFVEEYVVDMNASAAAVRAGYSKKSSGLYSTMMSNRAVVAAVEDALARKRARSEVDADRVLAELARVAFANVLDFVGADGRVDLTGLSRDAGAAVSRVSVEYFEGAAPPPPSLKLRRTSRSPKASRPSQEGEGCASSAPAVKRVTLTLADKTAALKQISRNLGLEASFAKASSYAEASEDGPDEGEREMVYVVQTGVPRWDDASGLRYLGREGGVNQLIRELRELGWRSPGEVEKLVERAGMAALPGPASGD